MHPSLTTPDIAQPSRHLKDLVDRLPSQNQDEKPIDTPSPAPSKTTFFQKVKDLPPWAKLTIVLSIVGLVLGSIALAGAPFAITAMGFLNYLPVSVEAFSIGSIACGVITPILMAVGFYRGAKASAPPEESLSSWNEQPLPSAPPEESLSSWNGQPSPSAPPEESLSRNEQPSPSAPPEESLSRNEQSAVPGGY